VTGQTWIRRFFAARYPLAFVVAAAALFVTLLATDTDISVWQDFRRDVFVRDSYRSEEIADIRFFDSSPYTIWLPSDLFVWRSIRAGVLPLWDPSQAGGYSPLLNMQNGVMHPVRWASAVAPFENVPSFLVVAELMLLAIGTHLMLARAFQLTQEASAAGALALVFCGYTMSVVQFSGAVLPLVHVPWILWAWCGWTRTRSSFDCVASISFFALMLISGHPLLVVTGIGVLAMAIGWFALADRRPREVLLAAGLGVAAIPIAAFVILPSAIAALDVWSYKNSTIHGAPFRAVGSRQFWDMIMATVVYQRDDWDKLDGGSISFYVGPALALLILFGIVVALRSRRGSIAAALLVLGLAMATPSDAVARFAEMTPLRYFKPWYLMFPLALAVGISTGLGVQALLEKLSGARRSIAAIALTGMVLLSVAPAVKDGLAASPMRAVRSPLREFLNSADGPFRVVGLVGQTHVPNSGAITGFDDVRFSSPVLPFRYRQWFRLASREAVEKSFPTTILPSSVESREFGEFNVKYVLRSRPVVLDVQTYLPRPGEKPNRKFGHDPVPNPATHPRVFELPSVTVYENRLSYHPRAHFATAALGVEPGIASAMRAMREPANAGVEVIETAGALTTAQLSALTRVEPGDSVSVHYPSTRRVRIETGSREPRILVLHDSWNPGWSATVDGVRSELFPVNLVSRGILVPAGKHVVEMSFVPRGFLAGAIISILALASTIVVAWRAGRDRRENQR